MCSQYKQGIYRPIHPEKLVGATQCTYRSSYELKFMRWADMNRNVLKWGYEHVVIPYISPIDRRVHQYYIDNIIIIKENDKIGKYLIEIKPKKQMSPPSASRNKKPNTLLYEQITYAKNQAKWQAAKEFCTKKGWVFLVLNEEDLNIV